VATQDEGEHQDIDDQAEAEPDAEPDADELEPIDPVNYDVVATARRRYGSAGAGLAAAMFAIDQALTGKQKPETVQVQEATGKPIDVDNDGITFPIDDVLSVEAPALERRPPLGLHKKPRRR
jgi:hypothetical protein